MGVTKEQRATRDRAEREAAWKAEEERVRKLGELFEALPESPEKALLLAGMTDRIIELYNAAKFEHGDAILEFLPNDYAYRFLEWYFDEDQPDTWDIATALSTAKSNDTESGPMTVREGAATGADSP